MADGVQGVLEDLLPDLLNMIENRLFTQEEVEAIIVARRELEYKLARRNPLQRHFLKAVRYEVELEEKRAARKVELQVTRPFSSDKSIIRRICSLFRRMLHRYPEESNWKEYIRFCVKAKALKPLSSAVVHALQLHPTSEDLWLIAEAVERSTKNDLDCSRAVLQKAVRVNADSVRMWREYFRLELEYLQMLLTRPTEKELSSELTAGEIPKLVFLEAMKTLPTASVNEFLKTCDSSTCPATLREFIASYGSTGA